MNTLVSTTASDEELQAALSDARYGLTVDAPVPPADPAVPPSEPAGDKPVESKTVAGQEPAKPTQEEEEEPNEEERKVTLPRGVQRKIEKLVRQKGEEKGKRELLETRVADLERQLAAKPEPVKAPEPEPVVPVVEFKPEPVPEPIPEPKEEDFQDYREFVKAMAKWVSAGEVAAAVAASKAEIAGLKQQLAEADTAKEQKVIADEIWQAKLEKARAAIPDFDKVMDDEAGKMNLSSVMGSALADADNGMEIAYYLRTNPEECKRIFEATNTTAKSTPADVRKALTTIGREFAKIEDKIAANAKPVDPAPPAADPNPPAADPPAAPTPTPEPPKPVPVSNAPAPIKPLGTKSAQTVQADLDRVMPLKEWEALRKRQRAG